MNMLPKSQKAVVPCTGVRWISAAVQTQVPWDLKQSQIYSEPLTRTVQGLKSQHQTQQKSWFLRGSQAQHWGLQAQYLIPHLRQSYKVPASPCYCRGGWGSETECVHDHRPVHGDGWIRADVPEAQASGNMFLKGTKLELGCSLENSWKHGNRGWNKTMEQTIASKRRLGIPVGNKMGNY